MITKNMKKQAYKRAAVVDLLILLAGLALFGYLFIDALIDYL